MTILNYNLQGSRLAPVKAAAGDLYHFSVYNGDARSQWVHIYDKATAPAVGDTPLASWPIEGDAVVDISFGAGRPFANGIQVALSAQQFTYDNSNNNTGRFDIQYD